MRNPPLFFSLALILLGLACPGGLQTIYAQPTRLPLSTHHKVTSSGKRALRETHAHMLYRLKIPGANYENGIGRLVFSPDHTLLAFANWDTLTLWDMKTGRMKKILAKGIQSIAFSPDGKLLCGFRDFWPEKSHQESISVRIWDVKTGYLRVSYPEQRSWGGVAFTSDGRIVGVGQYDTIVLYRMPHLKKIKTIGPSQWAVLATIAFSPDARLVAGVIDSKEAGEGVTVYVWHLPSGKPLVFRGGDVDDADAYGATTFLPIFFLPSSRQLVCGDCLLDLNQRHPRTRLILPVKGRKNLGQFRRGTDLVGFLTGKNTL